MYNQSATTERQTAVGESTIKKAYTTNLSSFSCHVQPLEQELTENIEGSFGKNWIMFCPVCDIESGDKVIVDSNHEYRVIGLETYNFSSNPHMEVTLRDFRE